MGWGKGAWGESKIRGQASCPGGGQFRVHVGLAQGQWEVSYLTQGQS